MRSPVQDLFLNGFSCLFSHFVLNVDEKYLFHPNIIIDKLYLIYLKKEYAH
jgi:hypothetical protein